jgi:hypothetical protein
VDVGKFFHDNVVGIVVGVLGTFAAAVIARLATRLFRFARAYGIRQLLQTGKDAVLHMAAFPRIQADPVLAVGYVGTHTAAIVLNGTWCLIAALAFFSGLHEPPWLRVLSGLACLWFAVRLLRRWLGIRAFYSRTAGAAIEEVKRTNPLLKQWYGIKDKKPFFEFPTKTVSGQPQAVQPQAAQHDANAEPTARPGLPPPEASQ